MINIQKEVIKMQKDKELTKKEMFEIFNRRYACKKYDKTKVVSDEDFMAIIEAGRISPSSFGLEPWKFILVKNEEMLNDMREFAWGAINSLNGASHIVMVLARKGVTGDSKYFEKFSHLPKILETPYVALSDDKKAKKVPPYKFEIEMLRAGKFDENVMEKIKNQ